MTERQLAEQKEAKKLKVYTVAFTVVLVAILVIAAIGIGGNVITNSGVRERGTVAMTVGTHEVSSTELNYYYIDAVNSMFSGDNSYLIQMGMLDPYTPLDQQQCLFAEGTWADYLMDYARSSLKQNYAMADAAAAEGYTLSQKYLATVDGTLQDKADQASANGYPDFKTYLKTLYGNGATEDSYRAYIERSVLAQAYYYHRADSLTFSDDEVKAQAEQDPNAYTFYTYNYYYVDAAAFLQGGTANEDGTTTYSDEEKAAAAAEAQKVANALTADTVTDVEALDNLITVLCGNEESSKLNSRVSGTGITTGEAAAQWITAAERQSGDKAALVNETTTDGVTTVNGYHVIFFVQADENLQEVDSVRHILVAFEGTTDEEKAAALAEAEALLEEWKSGEATEASFAALANERSDDGDGTNGGLYPYVGLNTGYVETFENWAADEARQAGDTGIVETVYGYHIMYFVGETGRTYRDVLAENTLKEAAMNEWFAQQVEAITITEGDMTYVLTNRALYNY